MKFLVKSPIQHDGERYEPGETIDLSPKDAAEMPWAVEEQAPPAKAGPPRGTAGADAGDDKK